MSKDIVKEWERPTFEDEYTRSRTDKAFDELEEKLKEPGKIMFIEDNKNTSTRPITPHYQQGNIEPIDFITSHDMNFNLGNAVKYITRCNHKGTKLEDLKKAIDYLNFEIEKVENENN